MRYFVECQGYFIDKCVIFQDNMSALIMEKNGRISASKCTKHIKAKYFLIKDYYDSGKIDLKYCPTDQMWEDVLTKPLQGQKFRDMRDFLQNCGQDYDEDAEQIADDSSMKQQVCTVASLWECVGEQTKLQVNQPRSQRSRSPTCVSQFQVNSKQQVGFSTESLHDKKRPTDKRYKHHIFPGQTGYG
jgi:hypothetical protein